MTVTATTRRSPVYTGNGTTTAFPFVFKVFANTNIQVLVTSAAGVISTAVLGSDYTVALNADQTVAPGGTVNYLTAPAAGVSLVILGALPYDQTLSLPGGGNFNPAAIENAFDRTEIQIQQLAEAGTRVLTLPAPAVAGTSLELPMPSASKLIGWNAAATALTNIDPIAFAGLVAFGTAKADTFTGNSVLTAFTLSSNPTALANIRVAVDGLVLTPTTDYTWVSGTTLTFTVAPATGAEILVQYMLALPQGVADLAASIGQLDASRVNFSGQTNYAANTIGWAATGLEVDPRWFGAKGDWNGTTGTDDTAAIQAAINWIPTNGTGTVKLARNANYSVTGALTFTSRNVVFDGQNSIITLTANIGAAYLFNVSGTNCEFRNFSYNKKTGVTAAGAWSVTGLQHVFKNLTSRNQVWARNFYCIDLKESHFSELRVDSDVTSKTGDIFYFDYCVNNTWSDCFLGFCARTFYGTATANPGNGNTNQGFSLTNIISVFAGKAATFDRVTALTIGSGCVFDFCETWGVFCTNGDDLTVAPGVWIAANVTNGFIGVGTGAAFTNAKVQGANITRGGTAITGSIAFSLSGPRAIVCGNHIAGGMDGGTVTDGTSRVYGNIVESPGLTITTPAGNSGVADYGSWTPAINFGGAAVGVTYTTAAGTYQKVGNEVTARCRLTLSSKGSSTGAFQLTGLPFTNNATYNGSALVMNPSGMATQCSPLGQVQKSAAAAVFFNLAVTALIDNTYFNNTTTFDCEFRYQVA